jgi:hypothetical protein
MSYNDAQTPATQAKHDHSATSTTTESRGAGIGAKIKCVRSYVTLFLGR